MAVRPKLSLTSETIFERLPSIRSESFPLVRDPKELYRERCLDEDANPYTVIVWRIYPGLSITDYTLDDGRPVKFVDDRVFEIVGTGRFITRCADF